MDCPDSYDEEEVAMNNFLSLHSRAGSHKRAFTLGEPASLTQVRPNHTSHGLVI